jgi:hypothetical protein
MRVTRLAAPRRHCRRAARCGDRRTDARTGSTTLVHGLDELQADLGFGLRYASFTMLGQRFLETPDAIGEPVEVTVG